MSTPTATLLDVVADLEKLADDLKAIHGTIWEKELETFTPIGEEKATELKPTLEEVRALSAQKSRAGLTKEVKAIIQKHGGTKLSDVAESEFSAMLKELAALPEEKEVRPCRQSNTLFSLPHPQHVG